MLYRVLLLNDYINSPFTLLAVSQIKFPSPTLQSHASFTTLSKVAWHWHLPLNSILFNQPSINMGLTPKQLAIWLSITCTATAADVELFDDPDSCSGSAAAFCLGVTQDTCCYRADKLYGSAGVGFVRDGTLQAYSMQNGQYCGVPFSAEYNTPICVITNLDLTISAALYRARRVAGRMDSQRQIKYQKAQLGAIKDGKQYLISHEKEAQIEPLGNRKGADYVAYVIQHADVVRDYVPAKHENVASIAKDN